MPICDAYISEGALSPSAERELLGRITDLLLESVHRQVVRYVLEQASCSERRRCQP